MSNFVLFKRFTVARLLRIEGYYSKEKKKYKFTRKDYSWLKQSNNLSSIFEIRIIFSDQRENKINQNFLDSELC